MTCGECQFYVRFTPKERPDEHWGFCHSQPPAVSQRDGASFPYCDRPIVGVEDKACRLYMPSEPKERQYV